MALTAAEKVKLQNILGCVLFKGVNPDGEEAYAFVALHLDEMNKVLDRIKETGGFNPKDFNATVLARYAGEPSEEVKRFMRRKFGYSEDNVVIQREKDKKPVA